MEPRHRSTLEAVTRATRDDIRVGDKDWRKEMYESVTDRKRRESAIQGAKLGATAALVPVALGALAYQKSYWHLNKGIKPAEAAKDTLRAAARAGLGAAAGAAGGLVAGPIGGVAAAVEHVGTI